MLLEVCPTSEGIPTRFVLYLIYVYPELTLARAHHPEDLDTVGQLFFELNSVPRLEKRLLLHDVAFR